MVERSHVRWLWCYFVSRMGLGWEGGTGKVEGRGLKGRVMYPTVQWAISPTKLVLRAHSDPRLPRPDPAWPHHALHSLSKPFSIPGFPVAGEGTTS